MKILNRSHGQSHFVSRNEFYHLYVSNNTSNILLLNVYKLKWITSPNTVLLILIANSNQFKSFCSQMLSRVFFTRVQPNSVIYSDEHFVSGWCWLYWHGIATNCPENGRRIFLNWDCIYSIWKGKNLINYKLFV